MTGFDYIVLGILGLSILLSVMRGLVQEVMALAGWAISAWVAFHYSTLTTPYMPQAIPSPQLRYLAAVVLLFFASWIVCSLLRLTLAQFLKVTGLRPLDRLLGAVFGVARGFLFTLMIVLIAGLTDVPRSPLWRNAMFSPLFEQAAVMALPWLPQDLARHIHYD
ncbi:membrane protein required for colicin V production [Silvimonas terrae]|uniref:Membrane protein required for colicin V production n=1 Tax=Silvimonas terrae TaxID=300266 RepID=A0A840RCG3_9NEIS|nr:CvpA family protein [Silvimonas terrae]MBB5189981.1 membrane protein required for colicin V production [Silvimonas terrae]